MSDYTETVAVDAIAIWEIALCDPASRKDREAAILDWLKAGEGMATGRQYAVIISEQVGLAWERANEAGFDDGFDWEFVPDFLYFAQSQCHEVCEFNDQAKQLTARWIEGRKPHFDDWINRPDEIDVGDKCIECGESTSFGSGRFVNRIPADNGVVSGYMCPECQCMKCDRCHEMVLEYEIIDDDIVCDDCITAVERMKHDPDLVLAKCDDCGEVFDEDELDEIEKYSMRVGAGNEVPAGQCPDCGALAFVIKRD
jgi:hypothetical protein